MQNSWPVRECLTLIHLKSRQQAFSVLLVVKATLKNFAMLSWAGFLEAYHSWDATLQSKWLRPGVQLIRHFSWLIWATCSSKPAKRRALHHAASRALDFGGSGSSGDSKCVVKQTTLVKFGKVRLLSSCHPLSLSMKQVYIQATKVVWFHLLLVWFSGRV